MRERQILEVRPDSPEAAEKLRGIDAEISRGVAAREAVSAAAATWEGAKRIIPVSIRDSPPGLLENVNQGFEPWTKNPHYVCARSPLLSCSVLYWLERCLEAA